MKGTWKLQPTLKYWKVEKKTRPLGSQPRKQFPRKVTGR